MASNGAGGAGGGGGGGGGGKMKLKLNTAQATSSASKPSADPTPTPSTSIRLNFNRASQAPSASPAQTQQTPKPQTPKGGGGRKASTAASNKGASAPSSATKPTPGPKKQQKKTPASATKPKLKGLRLNSATSGAASNAAHRKPSLIRLSSGKPLASPSASNPRLRLKNRGKPPTRPLGVGYDSECEDAEEDPAIEENFILRMLPGPDCDYVHKAIEDKKIGIPLSEGGADISMHVFSARRAALKVRGRTYAAVLVDLPCIIESMKSWDRKGWWKSADVAQMMIVTRQIENEDEARTAPLPSEVDDKTWQWPHGLTPPMHNVRRRRFRKRVSQKTIEQAEEEVERLLAEDADAQKRGGFVRSELLDLEQLRREEEGEDGEGDKDMDSDSQAIIDDDEFDLDWQAQFEARLGEEDNAIDAAGTPVPTTEPLLADSDSQAPTPAAVVADAEGDIEMADSPAPVDTSDTAAQEDSQGQTPVGAESSSDEDDDDEDEDEDDGDDEDIDDDAREHMQHMAEQREEITHLEKQIAERREQLSKQTNPLLQKKLAATIRRFEEERDVKRRGMGMGDDDDDE